MNSSSGTTAAKDPQPPFRPSLASELVENQPITSRSAEQRISIATYWGVLSQPDKQKLASGTRPHEREQLRRRVRRGRTDGGSDVELRHESLQNTGGPFVCANSRVL